MKDSDLKLIYIHKIGYNTKGEGNYEFIFSQDETNIDEDGWLWNLSPACDNAEPPDTNYIDEVFNLKTKEFNLECLHESVERPYMHGYHNIIALAYEVDFEDEDGNGFNSYEDMFDDQQEDLPLLVFHYGMTLENVKNLLYERGIILKGNDFIKSSEVKIE